jgi:NAD(P)-dependent dehydrogenase (short-subunit alcohol dehydrogenase family)
VIAKLFAAEGAKVVCAARTLQEGERSLKGSLSTTVSEIQEVGGQALAVQTDLSNEEGCTQLLETAKQQFGTVDVLVNNAVLIYFSLIKDLPVKRWNRAFAVNVHGPFMLSQKVLPDMIERGGGNIVNVSSGSAFGHPGPYTRSGYFGFAETMYGSTKAALNRFTQGLAEEVYQYGISVSAVSPLYPVSTPGAIYQKIVSGPNDPRSEPPEFTAKAVLILATEPAERVSGRIVYSQELLKEYGMIKP